jgi:hypothetical protein
METTSTMDITDAQIEALKQEAGVAGDQAQVAICDRALDCVRDVPSDSAWDDYRAGLAGCPDVESARRECARVIADAAAQE